MAATDVHYTVFGFHSRIDWKPTVFIDGLPKNRVCSACGLVPATIALLPCNHLLCSRCYDGSGDGERLVCPLDKDIGKPEDVIWSTLTTDNLLGRKIQCWNTSSGCDVVGEVIKVLDHFENDCQYHAVTCSLCKQSMAYKEVLGHLKTHDCLVKEVKTANNNHAITDAGITTFVSAVEDLRNQLSLQTCFYETKEDFSGHAQVFRERAAAETLLAASVHTLNNTLQESIRQSHAASRTTAQELAFTRNSINAMTNTLSEVVVLADKTNTLISTSTENTSQMSTVCRGIQQKLNDLTLSSAEGMERTEKRLDSLEKIGRELFNHRAEFQERLEGLNERLTAEVCGKLSVVVNASKAILQNTLSVSEPFLWDIEKWSELKEEATSKGEATALSASPKYFYGYSILPGVKIKKGDGDLNVHLYYHVCQGDYDLLLDWPIKRTLMIQVLDAERKELPEYASVDTWIGALNGHKMPTNARNNYVWSTRSIKVTDIERNLCVQDDKVSVKFTVS
ncbi:hypothetical protein HPB48_009105 [Haemaphysalis longicornis]|uniref:RING-type domain-containing protein n=1 Tax=Haemaphysalis longicornis TaxID=44386 RepID=A0A9J6FLZ3_HAELO|nr:hypothetical protein HPB48_009105 [Haemaphysalis longicornis]